MGCVNGGCRQAGAHPEVSSSESVSVKPAPPSGSLETRLPVFSSRQPASGSKDPSLGDREAPPHPSLRGSCGSRRRLGGLRRGALGVGEPVPPLGSTAAASPAGTRPRGILAAANPGFDPPCVPLARQPGASVLSLELGRETPGRGGVGAAAHPAVSPQACRWS